MSLIDVEKGINMFATVNVPILGMIENMSYFICDSCDKEHKLFGESGAERLSALYGIELIGRVPFTPDTVSASDRGQPPAADPTSVFAGIYGQISDRIVREAAKARHADEIPQVNIEWAP